MSYTTQQIYDKVVNHMRTQGNSKGYYLDRGWCYVNPDNPCERCAKGILMEVHDKYGFYTVKRLGSDELQVEHYIGRKLSPSEISILNELELVFERRPEEIWETKFKSIAKKYNLIYSIVTKANINIEEETNHGAKSKA